MMQQRTHISLSLSIKVQLNIRADVLASEKWNLTWHEGVQEVAPDQGSLPLGVRVNGVFLLGLGTTIFIREWWSTSRMTIGPVDLDGSRRFMSRCVGGH